MMFTSVVGPVVTMGWAARVNQPEPYWQGAATTATSGGPSSDLRRAAHPNRRRENDRSPVKCVAAQAKATTETRCSAMQKGWHHPSRRHQIPAAQRANFCPCTHFRRVFRAASRETCTGPTQFDREKCCASWIMGLGG